MKTTILKNVPILCMVIAMACKNPKSFTLRPGEKTSLVVDSILVPAAVAKQGIDAYDTLCQNSFKDVPIKAYTVRAEDLLAAMGLSKDLLPGVPYKYVRVYMGYDRDKKKGRDPGFRLYIVPVEYADLDGGEMKGGRDMMLDSTGHVIPSNGAGRREDEAQFVLDLNAPCPKTCATDGSSLAEKAFKRP